MKGEGRESRQGSEIITAGEGDRRYFSARWLLLIPSEVLQGGKDGHPPQSKDPPQRKKNLLKRNHQMMGNRIIVPCLDCSGGYGQSLWPIRFTTDLHTPPDQAWPG